ncbi:TonB-dependent receptor [Mariniradius saccharolyticus AK6]|uniref:TonB-dependent receptor n=1 Tax=Mariniradius saccharolyticus AK6 TaxID=1239962 RepID=M7XD74_9BACT|nr:TonB-dependent receptor [Mariniradius saccharolyticus]EMS35370.1 TonB-dependent receptor [Mariniradius saccharolyticus AK6]
MKKQVLFLTILVGWMSMASVMAQGVIRGKVIDDQNLSLPGANVILEGTVKGSVTNQLGDFVILDVPAGNYKVIVTYLGYNSSSREVALTDGQTLDLRFQLDPGTLDGVEVIVFGDRLKGQARALNQQKTNSNITNIVAADQIGRFPDANIGDAIKRIPGITMQNDQGEARNIIIRGMAPELNSVMINGERVPSAEGDNRRIQMDLIPSDMIQTIEVNKSVLPDMDADAIGGAVNLVTRKAPNRLRVSGTAASGYNFLSTKPIWTGGLIIGDRVFNDKLGVIFSGSYNNHNFGSDNYEAQWAETDDPNNPVVVNSFDIRKYDVQRVRRSASLALDYEFNRNHSIILNTMYNWRDDWESRYRFRVDRTDLPFGTGNFTQIEPNLFQMRGRTAIQTKGGIDNDRVRNTRLEDQRVVNATLSGSHLFNRLKMTWNATYAKASEDRPNERYITHRGNADVILDIRDPFKVLTSLVNEDSRLGLGLNEIYESNNNTYEEDFNSRLDFALPYAGNKGLLKFGGRLREKYKQRTDSYDVYDPIVDLGTDGNRLGGLPTSLQNDRVFLNGPQYVPGRFVTKEFLGGLDLYNESLFDYEDAVGEYITGNYEASERITAGYVMTDYQFNPKLSAIFGLRLENTNLEYRGYEFDEDNGTFQQSATVSDNYNNFMPGAHFKYDLKENQIVRLAWANTIARPNYFDLVPYAIFSPDNQTLQRGNPNLVPTTSMNFDLMYEHYYKSVGVFSAGGFYKDVDNFIYQKTQLNINDPDFGQLLESTRPENGGTANVYGFETSIQRQFDFLPGIWKGLGIFANYTFTDSRTTGIQERENDNLKLPGTARNMFNASLSFETEKIVLRVSVNHASGYLDEVGSSTFDDFYYDRQTFLDVNASYAITKNWRFFAEANNLTNQPLRYYQGIRPRTAQEEYYNVRMNFGVKFDLFD